MKIVEPARELSVKGSYDVLVIGAGVAGVSAALACARNGKSVCLVEREYILGGLATAGIVAIYLPLCDGQGHQMIGGISEELLKESVRYGSGEIPSCWKEGGDPELRQKIRYKLRFDPPAFACALDQLVAQAGIHLMLGTTMSSAVKEGQEIRYCILENREGRFAVSAKIFIDASGDAVLAWSAGENTAEFVRNRLAGWYYSYDGSEYRLNIVQESLKGPDKEVKCLYGGISTDDVTQFCLDSRQMLLQHALQFSMDTTITQIATIPQIRMTRRLKGTLEIDESDEGRVFQDAVGCFGDWRKAGPHFTLPYSALVGETKNLLVAGRCISASESAGDIIRAIPVCALSGEAAGTAAALALDCGAQTVRSVPLDSLRLRLLQNNNILNWKVQGEKTNDKS